MKVLLDAMMPKEIGELLDGHEVSHAADQGWRQLNNGKLLAAGEAEGFEVLITKDVSMPHQQNMRGRTICLLIVRPRSQNMEDLLSLAPRILQSLPGLTPGTVTTPAAT